MSRQYNFIHFFSNRQLIREWSLVKAIVIDILKYDFILEICLCVCVCVRTRAHEMHTMTMEATAQH